MVARRPIGWRAMKSFSACTGSAADAMRPRKEGVSTVPGQRALQRRPVFTKSAAMALVRPMTAALVAP